MLFKKPPCSTRKIWDPYCLALASKMSMEAWQRSNIKSLSQFLADRKVRNLFLTNQFLVMNSIHLQSEPPYCVLLESPTVGSKWGASDMLLDMSRAHQKEEYLQAAAGFGGSVYLVGVEFSDDEASKWWDALRHSHTPPHRLVFLYRFLSSTLSNETRSGATAAQDLLDAIIHNKRIKEVTVFLSDLEFGSSTTIHQGFSLNRLHLEKVSLSDEFLEALSKLNSESITKTLTLSSHKGSTWHPWFHKFLQWQLEELSLLGFGLEIPDLIAFLKCLQECNNMPLHSLSLGEAKDDMSMALAVGGTYPRNDSFYALVAVIVDALYGSGLAFFDVQGLQLRNPAIEARLLLNQQRHFADLKLQKKVSAMALRLFICGDAFAGKTTLSLSLAAACSKRTRAVHKVKGLMIDHGFKQAPDRTRGIEVYKIVKDNIHLSMWDMAGQREFHAFHDLMFPDPSSNHSSPAIFMFVWSPVDSNDKEDGENKSIDAFQDSFRYWLKFIASKTRQSNVARKVIVVITRNDQRDLVCSLLTASIDALKEKFKGIVEIIEVMEVDARSTASVKPLASCIFKTAKDVLHGVETYDKCRKVSRYLSSKTNVFRDQPIIAWDAFEKFCEEKFQIKNKHVQRAIASSLNESGDLIYLGNMLVLDVSWFCRDIMGKLIYIRELLSRRILPIKGFAPLEYAESILQIHTQSKVPGSQLMDLMEAMHLCCKDPNDPQGKIFIAAFLFTSSSRKPGMPLKWRGNINGKAVYLGRRLECDRKDLTFLTPGLFPLLQVLFLQAFGEIGADVELDRDVMSICIRDMEIILEFGIAKGEHVIDVMARAPAVTDIGNTLTYVENKIIQTIIRVCAQPVGNQGVKLVEGIIHPDCLLTPASLKEREDQCVLIQDLKQQLRRQIEAGNRPQKLLYEWKGSRHRPFVDLLGVKVFEEVLLLYKKSLESADEEAQQIIDLTRIQNSEITHEDVRSSSAPTSTYMGELHAASTSTYMGDLHAASTSTRPVYGMPHKMGETSANLFEGESSLQHQSSEQIQEDLEKSIPDDNGQQNVLRFIKIMVQELQNIKAKVDGLQSTVQSVHEGSQLKLDAMQRKLDTTQEEIYQIRNDLLPKIQKIVEQTLYFAVGYEEGKVPRLVFLTTDQVGRRRKMVTAIFKDLKSVRIELFCEHREHPHRVEGQKGLCVTTINEGALKKALPWLNGLLKLLTLVAKVGAHIFAGLGNAVPDLASIISLGLDTPGFLDNHGLPEACSSREALAGWQQWLVSVLEKHGGMSEKNIFENFKLKRAIYQDTSHVAWLCPKHYPQQGAPASSLIRPHPLI